MSVGASSFQPGAATTAAPFTPGKKAQPAPPPVVKKPEPKPVDKVAESLKKLDHSEDQIKEFKDVKSLLKENGDKPISMDLFKKI